MTGVNVQHIQQVPGRKTEVKDCPGIAPLLPSGLLRASFIPPRPIRERRNPTRQRIQVVRYWATVANRLPKVLEDANLKLAGVATDIVGASARALNQALIAGEHDPARRAELARRRLRAKIPLLSRALTGRVTDPPRSQLQDLREQGEHLEQGSGRLDARILERASPLEAEVERLATIPGVNRQAAEVILAEVGVDMSPVPTAGHLCSWAGMSPGNNPSVGNRFRGRTTKGHPGLRSVLVQTVWAASHTEQTRLSATSPRLAKRIGKKRAAVAGGRKILKLV